LKNVTIYTIARVLVLLIFLGYIQPKFNVYGALYTDPNGFYQLTYDESIWDIDYDEVKVNEDTGSSEVMFNLIDRPLLTLRFEFDIINDINF
jgi:hypothetical protein